MRARYEYVTERSWLKAHALLHDLLWSGDLTVEDEPEVEFIKGQFAVTCVVPNEGYAG